MLEPIFTGAEFDEVWPLVRDHHYAHRRTADPMFCFAARSPGGLFGDTGTPVAAIVYTAPVNRYFGAGAVELARLVRHPQAELRLSRFIAWSLRWLKANTDLRYCLSYAECAAGHHGGIYQATNFLHVMVAKGNRQYENPVTGETVSGRSFDQRRPEYRSGWLPKKTGKKFLYVFPLGERKRALLRRFNWQELPYPKPNATRPLDEMVPTVVRAARPRRVAPDYILDDH